MSGSVHDLSDYRKRRALRDCGRASAPRDFLWLSNGVAMVMRFQPARTTATAVQSPRLRGA